MTPLGTNVGFTRRRTLAACSEALVTSSVPLLLRTVKPRMRRLKPATRTTSLPACARA